MSSQIKNIPRLRFKEFSGEWEIKRLGEIGDFKNGINKDSSDFGFGVPFLNLMDVFGKIEINTTELGLVNANENEISQYKLLEGDVLFVRSSVKREGVGETVVCDFDLPNTVYSGFLIRFRSNNILHNKFKKYCFWNPKFRFSLIRLSTSSANTNINQESLNKLLLNFPNLKEQQKIADFLSSVDQKIQHLKQKKQLLEQYKKGMMQKLFSQQIRFKDENGMDYPEWNHGVLGFLSDVRDGTHDSPKYVSRGYPLITSKNLTENGNLDLTNVDYISEDDYLKINQRSEVHVGDILFGMIGTIGNPVYLNQSGFAIKNVALIKEKIKLLNQYLIHYLKSELIMRQFYIINTGGTQKFIALGKIRELFIDLPCLKEQKKLADFLSSLDKKIECVNSQITQTEQFKKGLLQQLLV